MEDILEIYKRPRDPDHPLVCFDEMSKQQVKETRIPIPVSPGQPARHDYEYERNGTSNLFLFFAPLEGWRKVHVTERRTAIDFAYCMRDLVDVYYPDARRITLVMDNLNTHVMASLYKAFPPAEARRIWERLEVHYTPKHGSWLNMAEIELSVLSCQSLDCRIPDREVLRKVVAGWEEKRNTQGIIADWRFTTADARIKLKRLYPMVE
jgi:hypothetical protein